MLQVYWEINLFQQHKNNIKVNILMTKAVYLEHHFS